MKEIYTWVPWFRELGRVIADGDPDDLVRRAKATQWSEGDDSAPISLFRYGDENVDPFSFVYTLASRCGSLASRTRICTSVEDVFGLDASMPVDDDDAFIFPQGTPQNTLFHMNGAGNPPLLWRLFQDAVRGVSSVSDAHFSEALGIGNVGTAKLSQTLFLVNAADFIPYDKTTALFRADAPSGSPDLATYRESIAQLRGRFPGCETWEINLFAYLVWSGKLKVGANAFCASTRLNRADTEFDEEFFKNNWIRTDGPGSHDYWVGPPKNDTRSGTSHYQLDDPEPGDLILLGRGSDGRGVGVVTGNDYSASETPDGNDRIHVVWINKQSCPGVSNVQTGIWKAWKILADYRNAEPYRPTFEMLDRLTGADPQVQPPRHAPVSSVSHPRNQILYGPPGTGKTWSTVNLALAIVDGKTEADHDLERYHELLESGRIAAVTFHQNFAYEDFIEGIRPVLGDVGGLRYERRDGLFKTMAERAKNAPEEQRFVLIIDEINRGNVARIFGELITLIEESRRDDGAEKTVVKLPYSGNEFSVPGNLYLIGTMNTADRSIELLDTALRRRFVFRELMPDVHHPDLPQDVGGVDCRQLLGAMNQRTTLLLDREHQIGHTYLLDVSSLEELGQRFRERIFPLLQEYFFDDWSKIHAVLGGNPFVVSSTPDLRAELADLVDPDQRIWQRLSDSDPRWTSADAYRAIYQTGTDADAS
ncbi:MAG: AAA family ATPase [Gammaproteobacteria bacterium]|nr:AAA family ATPase [Gammaproteobacteria bacterium]